MREKDRVGVLDEQSMPLTEKNDDLARRIFGVDTKKGYNPDLDVGMSGIPKEEKASPCKHCGGLVNPISGECYDCGKAQEE